MFASPSIDFQNKPTGYAELARQLEALLANERDAIANQANAAALLFHSLPDLNWAGFYRLLGSDLVLGPFQGKPACVRIPSGKGVCGTALAQGRTLLVRDVHAFPGHIACDEASRSEIVVPLLLNGRPLGVLDLDSHVPSRFNNEDQPGIEHLAAILVAASDWA